MALVSLGRWVRLPCVALLLGLWVFFFFKKEEVEGLILEGNMDERANIDFL